LRLRSNPTYNITQASSVEGFVTTSRVCSPRRPHLHAIHSRL
jgi:hypothetical protein